METRSGQGLMSIGSVVERWQSSLRARRAAFIASQGPDYLPTVEPGEIAHDCPGCGGTRWRLKSGAGPREDPRDTSEMYEPCPICCPPKPGRSLSEYVIPPGFPAAARHEMEHAVEIVKLVIETGGPPWIVLTGGNGSGKTMLASILLGARQKAGDSGQMWRAEELLQWLQETQGHLDHLPIEERATLSSRTGFIRRLKWLVLDELGKERKSTWGQEQMEALINRRYQDAKDGHGGGLIATSNDDPTEMGSPFSDAVRSRFRDGGVCEIVNLTHVPDFRPTLRPVADSPLGGGVSSERTAPRGGERP